MTTLRKSPTVPKTVSLIQSFLPLFQDSTREERDKVLQSIAEAEATWCVVDLPHTSYVKGEGVGYYFKLVEALKAKHKEVGTITLNSQHYGVPSCQLRLVLVAGPKKVSVICPTKVQTLAEADPTILYHANCPMVLRSVRVGLFSSYQNVLKSAEHPLAAPEAYGTERPVVARQDGNSYICVSLLQQQWLSLFGLSEADKLLPVQVSPVPMLQAVLDALPFLAVEDLHSEPSAA